MQLTTIIPAAILILNLIFIIALIFFERKDPSATWAWLFVLTLLPVLGFVVYIFLGLTPRKRRVFQQKMEQDKGRKMAYADKAFFPLNDNTPDFPPLEEGIIRLGLSSRTPAMLGYNDIKIYTHGQEKFADLFTDLKEAEDFIHINYFIIRPDRLGKELIEILTDKAREGVEVRLLYDRMGSRNLPREPMENLRKAGGEAVPFAPFVLDINYRNHRKNCIIDGQIGYVGGINIGIEYIGESHRFGDWRDTHLKLRGESVDSLQHRFFLDWSFATGENFLSQPRFFPEKKIKGSSPVQIVTSGPDSKEEEIKTLFLKMIYGAEKTVYIQTPYFIPDSSMLEALKVAAYSGVDVRVMIPDRADKPIVYAANYSFVGQLLEAGVRFYHYEKGFLHSKTITADGRIASVGTTNMDVRSFKLNFEINAFIYDRKVAGELEDIFFEDLEYSSEITPARYAERGVTMKIRESFARLLSPIL